MPLERFARDTLVLAQDVAAAIVAEALHHLGVPDDIREQYGHDAACLLAGLGGDDAERPPYRWKGEVAFRQRRTGIPLDRHELCVRQARRERTALGEGYEPVAAPVQHRHRHRHTAEQIRNVGAVEGAEQRGLQGRRGGEMHDVAARAVRLASGSVRSEYSSTGKPMRSV